MKTGYPLRSTNRAINDLQKNKAHEPENFLIP